MTPEQIQEKYGIEPIMKEMWVWDSDKEDAEYCFVLSRDSTPFSPYVAYDAKKEFIARKYASETNPNEKEPKVGDKGYFWGAYYESFVFDRLVAIFESDHCKYKPETFNFTFPNFSHEKQPWMQ